MDRVELFDYEGYCAVCDGHIFEHSQADKDSCREEYNDDQRALAAAEDWFGFYADLDQFGV